MTVLVTRRKVEPNFGPPVTYHHRPYHYVREYDVMIRGDRCGVKGHRATFIFDGLALDDETNEVRHVSLFELDAKGGTSFRAFREKDVLIPDLEVLLKWRDNEDDRKKKQEKASGKPKKAH